MGRRKPKKSKEERLIRQEKQFTKKWTESLVFRIYDLAKQGKSEAKIAKIIGVEVSTFRKWKESKTYVKLAMEEAKMVRTSSGGKGAIETFQEYVFSNLPSDLQRVWQQLTAYEEEENSVCKIDALLRNKGESTRKHLYVHALVSSDFNASEACRLTNTSLSTVNTWKRDEKFAELLEEIEEHKKNFFENALLGLIKRGDSSATIFANRTKNRDRGYSEKTTVEVTGSINHFHNVLPMDRLNLSVETRTEILEAMRTLNTSSSDVGSLHQAKEVLELPNG